MTSEEAFLKFESCSEVADVWEDGWVTCPLCGARIDNDGLIVHADPEQPQ